jgi:hypothetical protein
MLAWLDSCGPVANWRVHVILCSARLPARRQLRALPPSASFPVAALWATHAPLPGTVPGRVGRVTECLPSNLSDSTAVSGNQEVESRGHHLAGGLVTRQTVLSLFL